MKAVDSIPVGVVVERREIDNPWEDYTWMPVAVIPGAPPLDATGEWKELQHGDGWVQYHAGTLELELFRGETDGYRTNLSNPQPYVYIVMTPGEAPGEPEIMPFIATVSPHEAEGYTEDSEQIVEGVPMPPDLVAWVSEFIEKYHVKVPFKKRKREPYDPRKGSFRSPKGPPQ
ncbi:MAG: DUF3305 domain-containing protein [Rhodospirillales bacterium]|nr:DUF3305 domain-containing protein [Rhodospirillales bacterium]